MWPSLIGFGALIEANFVVVFSVHYAVVCAKANAFVGINWETLAAIKLDKSYSTRLARRACIHRPTGVTVC